MPTDTARAALHDVARSLSKFTHSVQLRAAMAIQVGSPPAARDTSWLPSQLLTHLAELGCRPGPAPDIRGGRDFDGYALAVFPVVEPGCDADWRPAHDRYCRLAGRMAEILLEFPDSTFRRLGLGDGGRVNHGDWTRVLFHLADHFCKRLRPGAVLYRACRWMNSGTGRSTIPVTAETKFFERSDETLDCHPGIAFSVLPETLDLVTATGLAVELMLTALAPTARPPSAEVARGWRDQFRDHSVGTQTFCALCEVDEGRVYRFDRPYDGRPLSEWDNEPAHLKSFRTRLSSGPAAEEWVVIRGNGVRHVQGLLDQAAELMLPPWPPDQPPVLLDDLARWHCHHEMLVDGANGVELDGYDLALQELLSAGLEHSDLVTDGRDNVGRWLGFVFSTLRLHQPLSLRVETRPSGHRLRTPGWQASLRLEGIDLFEASARAIELAGWLRDGRVMTDTRSDVNAMPDASPIPSIPPSAPPPLPPPTPAHDTSPRRRPSKRSSSVAGDGRVRLISALTLHHRYGTADSLNTDPVASNELARQADVSKSTASAFFKREFQGYAQYRSVCRDHGRLTGMLSVLNGDRPAHTLFGRTPPDEGERM